MIVADRRLWLTADRARVVEDGDPAAAFLFAAPGTEILPQEAERLGLSLANGKVVIAGVKKNEPVQEPKKGKR